MLKELRIRNIILVEAADIQFSHGFNVLSGETGSDKSAIMNSLNLITGDRADSGSIRRGCEKATVEAIFDVRNLPLLKKLLEDAGIDHEDEEDLIIRREISHSGKSRAFINNQLAQLSLLRIVGQQLLEIAGQHANQKLMSLEKHREILDIFGDLEEEAVTFAKSWENENLIRKELDLLVSSESQRLREIEVCRMELEELDEACIKENEDEELFAEYTLLANAEELASKANEINQTLSGERQAVLLQLNKLKTSFEQLVRIDPDLSEQYKSFGNAVIELQEIAYGMRNYSAKIEYNPERLHHINERLALITRLKRKFGSTVSEIQVYAKASQEKLARLESADFEIDDLKGRLSEIQKTNDLLAGQLCENRKKAAKKLEKNLVVQLRSLNMPKVEFNVEVTPQKKD